jgi:Tol biopolymer transport system component
VPDYFLRLSDSRALMNSWHGFSPNGRWLVFSSKSRSPYTQMFLTHLNEAGNDSPAILVENATAANRAAARESRLTEFQSRTNRGVQHLTNFRCQFIRAKGLLNIR